MEKVEDHCKLKSYITLQDLQNSTNTELPDST